MNTHGKMIAADTIVFERLLPGPIERVWAYLTESEKRGKWLAKGEMELFEGGKVSLHFLHKELSSAPGEPGEKYKDMEKGHAFTGKVLAVSPPHLLSFSWGNDGVVVFALTEKDDEVLLVLTHSKLPDNKEVKCSVAGGWHTHLDILATIFLGGRPLNFWRKHEEMEAWYAGK